MTTNNHLSVHDACIMALEKSNSTQMRAVTIISEAAKILGRPITNSFSTQCHSALGKSAKVKRVEYGHYALRNPSKTVVASVKATPVEASKFASRNEINDLIINCDKTERELELKIQRTQEQLAYIRKVRSEYNKIMG